jgi:predicted small metal-binding protein
MFADEALRCECGYEVRASDEAARVDEVRRHASEAHGIDLSADVALDVVRRVTARAERRTEERGGHPSAVAGDKHLQRERPDAQTRDAAHEHAEPDDSRRAAESYPIQRGVDR